MRNFFSEYNFLGLPDFADQSQLDYAYDPYEGGRQIFDLNSLPAFQPAKIIIPLVAESPSGTALSMASPAVFELSSLLAVNGGDGSAGFVINGIDAIDESGFTVSSAGDVNGDGFDDVLIGAPQADPNGNLSGESYVVFGRDDGTIPFAAELDLSTLNGTNGFVINGIQAFDSSGLSVSDAGDINGDGFADILIGAPEGSPNGSASGESYVIFGRDDSVNPFAATFELSTLDGTNGFIINGVKMGDFSGRTVSNAGDVNGDGFDDILIGARYADPNGNVSGESYVVFGRDDSTTPFNATLELSALDGTNGFVINGIDTGNQSGRSLSSAGDINGDGFDDILISAAFANSNSGETYVILGRDDSATPFTAALELSSLNGTNGFVINGDGAYDYSGVSVSNAGDINGDGFDDILIGAYGGNPNGAGSGESYIIFGSADFGPPPPNGATQGNDDLTGTSGDDTIDLLGGDDTITGGDGRDRLEGGDGEDILRGGADTDFLLGGGARDRMYGGDQSDRMFGQGGNDIMDGGGSNDIMYGGGNADIMRGGLGNDNINGGSNFDRLFGQEGRDIIYGGNAGDRIDGGSGNDMLFGGNRGGADGFGDTFIFANNFGTDVIGDFEDDLDVIDFSGHTGINDFNDVLARASEDGTSLLIATNANNTLIIENFSLAELDASDFVF